MSNRLICKVFGAGQTVATLPAVVDVDKFTLTYVEQQPSTSNWRVIGLTGNVGSTDADFYQLLTGYSSEAAAVTAMNKLMQALDPADLV